jgi:ABC-type sugar transport system substrate-binding protein
MMKKILTMVLAVCLLASCFGVVALAEAPKVAGMIYLEDNFMRMLAAGYKKAASEYNADYSEYNCVSDQAAEAETIQTYITKGLDGIVIAPLNEESSIAACKDAAAMGVKIALCDSTLADADFTIGGYTSDQKQLGASTGSAAVKWLEANGYSAENPCKIAVVCFDSLLPTKSGARVDGFLETVGDMVEVVDREDAWEQDKAIETVSNILTAHPEVEMIYAANDGGTIGATMACENNGYQKAVFGIDASKQMVQLLQSDKNVLQAVTGQDAYAMGYQAMTLMCKTILGEDTGIEAGTTITVDGLLLSRDDVQGLEDYLTMWAEVVGD